MLQAESLAPRHRAVILLRPCKFSASIVNAAQLSLSQSNRCGAGEYGHLLKDPTLREQFALLQLRFPSATTEIKASLLSAYLKMQVSSLCDLASPLTECMLTSSQTRSVNCTASGFHAITQPWSPPATLESSRMSRPKVLALYVQSESMERVMKLWPRYAGGGKRVGSGACKGHPGSVHQVRHPTHWPIATCCVIQTS